MHSYPQNKLIQLSIVSHFLRPQKGIGEIAEEKGFGSYISLRLTCWDVREGEQVFRAF